jgi:methionine-rich copper-binding protein CopC
MEHHMKNSIPWIALAALSISGLAAAHAHLHSSSPANHSTLSVAPKTITLEFQEPVHLTALAIKYGDGETHKLVPLPAAPSTTFAMPLPALDAGSYVVTWRALSDDGHVMSATIQFAVRPAVSSAAK